MVDFSTVFQHVLLKFSTEVVKECFFDAVRAILSYGAEETSATIWGNSLRALGFVVKHTMSGGTMLAEVRDMRDDSFQIIFPRFSRWIEISANEMYSLPCQDMPEFKKLIGNKIRPLPDDDFKQFLQNLSDDDLAVLRHIMARNIAPGNELTYQTPPEKND